MDVNSKHDIFRLLADVYEKNPTLPMPSGFYSNKVTVYCFSFDEMESKQLLRGLGSFTKKYSDSYFEVMKMLAPGLTLEITFSRATLCTPKVVGLKKVPAVTIPAKPAVPEEVIPEHEEEIIEWDCKAILPIEEKGDPQIP